MDMFCVFCLTCNIRGSIVNCSDISLHFSDYVKQLLVEQYVYSEGTLCDSKTSNSSPELFTFWKCEEVT